jgi:hypothetical protein
MSAKDHALSTEHLPVSELTFASRGRMAHTLVGAYAEITALEQELVSLIRLSQESQDEEGGAPVARNTTSSRPETLQSRQTTPHVATHDATQVIHDFSRDKRKKIASMGERVVQTSPQNVMAWNAWHRLGRFANELNPQAYLGRIDGFFGRANTINEQSLKAMDEVFEEVWRTDDNHAQRIEETLGILKSIRESIKSASAAIDREHTRRRL